MVNEREIEYQNFMIRPGLGESKTAEGFLRDIVDGICSALVNKNIHQKILPECTVVEVVGGTSTIKNPSTGLVSGNPR